MGEGFSFGRHGGVAVKDRCRLGLSTEISLISIHLVASSYAHNVSGLVQVQ